MKNNFTKLIASVVLSGVVLSNFAFISTAYAQQQGTALTPQFLAAAQSSESECRRFRNAIFNESGGTFKAVFRLPVTVQGTAGAPNVTVPSICRIVPSDAPDVNGIYMDPSYTSIPPGSYDLQTQIEKGTGLPAGAFTKAKMADIESKTDASGFSKLVGWTLNWMLSVVNFFLLWMTALAGNIFTTAVNWILDGTKTVPDFVYVGWSIVRDISNMFFILILIVIGLAAILRVESYDYRHLLVETVIMALLVNFSLIIATTLIDVVGTLTAIFQTRHGEIWSFLYANVNFGDTSWSEMPNGWMAGLFQGLSKIVFTFVGLATFLALTGMFVIRIIGIYVLLIFSPLAYVLDVLPVTKHFAHEWWEYFMKYLIWPPVALFVLRLAMLVAKDPAFQDPADSAFKFIVLMAFMWGAVIVAEHAGMVGGNAVVHGAEKFAHGTAHFLGHKADMWLAKGAAMEGPGWKATTRRALSFASPVAWKKGYEARHHHHEAEAYTVAIGKRADTLNKYISREDSDFALKARNIRVADEMKQIPMKDKGEMTERASLYFHHGEIDKALGYATKLAAQGDLNEVLNKLGYENTAEGLQKMFDKYVVPKIGKDNAYRMGAELSKVAEDQGQWNMAGAFTLSQDGKRYEKNDDPGGYANLQRSKGSAQNMIRVTGRHGAGFREIVTPSGDWINTGIDRHGVDYLKSITGDQLQEWERNGNKHLKANIVANNSQRVMEMNPYVWASAANEYAQLTPDARVSLRATVAAPSDPAQVITRAQADFFDKNYIKGDPALVKKYQTLIDYAHGTDEGDMARVIHQQTGSYAGAEPVMSRGVTELYSGAVDTSAISAQLNALGMAASSVTDAINRMSSAVGRLKVNNLSSTVFTGVGDVNTTGLKTAIAQAIESGLAAGHKIGDPAMETVINTNINTYVKSKDKKIDPAVASSIAHAANT